MPTFRRILHPTDFSTPSRRAFAVALDLARRGRGTLTLVHVLTPPMPPVGDMAGYVTPATYEALEAGERRRATAALAKLVAKARAARVPVRTAILAGLPHEQIARQARKADLVVMGTHGRTGLPRLFLGSVAGRVVATAPCPVLTVRGR